MSLVGTYTPWERCCWPMAVSRIWKLAPNNSNEIKRNYFDKNKRRTRSFAKIHCFALSLSLSNLEIELFTRTGNNPYIYIYIYYYTKIWVISHDYSTGPCWIIIFDEKSFFLVIILIFVQFTVIKDLYFYYLNPYCDIFLFHTDCLGISISL